MPTYFAVIAHLIIDADDSGARRRPPVGLHRDVIGEDGRAIATHRELEDDQ